MSAISMHRDRGNPDEDMAGVLDSPEWTAEKSFRAKSFAEAFPDLAPSLKDGATIATAGTTPVSIRLGDDVLAHYRAGGRWEARINADLRKAAGIEVRPSKSSQHSRFRHAYDKLARQMLPNRRGKLRNRKTNFHNYRPARQKTQHENILDNLVPFDLSLAMLHKQETNNSLLYLCQSLGARSHETE